MTRGLPYSIVVHALVLVLVVVYGNRVTRRPVQPAHAIPFRLVHAVAAAQEETTPASEPVLDPETHREPRPQVTPPERKRPQDLPPKEVPRKDPEAEQPEPEPERKESVITAERDDQPDSTESAPQDAPAGGLQVQGTDSDFPFPYYLVQVKNLVDRNWNPRQLGFGGSSITCRVHLEISRAGVISGVSLVGSSGVGVYDREALRAVEATRLPPLPARYPGPRLGVEITFNLEPGY